jgi:hypothetical protein
MNRAPHWILLLIVQCAILCLSGPSGSTVHAAEKGAPKQIYGRVQENLKVELENGTTWELTKDESFPVIRSVAEHKKVVLRLANTNFTVDAARVEIVEAKEETKALQSYRKAVGRYLDRATTHWRSIHEKATGAPETPPKPEPAPKP